MENFYQIINNTCKKNVNILSSINLNCSSNLFLNLKSLKSFSYDLMMEGIMLTSIWMTTSIK